MEFETGPYVSTAVLCERMLEEKDGVVTLVRIIDRLIVTAQGPEAPATLPPTLVSVVAVIWLRSGTALGRHVLKLRPEKPSGTQLEATELSVHFEGEERGSRTLGNIALTADEEGLYWFDVLLDDVLLTRIPLRIMYQRQTAGG
jgi:hypothetical protein